MQEFYNKISDRKNAVSLKKAIEKKRRRFDKNANSNRQRICRAKAALEEEKCICDG